jgi:hypothetical protein
MYVQDGSIDNIGRFVINVGVTRGEPPEKTYTIKESRPLYHMRNVFDRDSNPARDHSGHHHSG